MDNKGVLVVVSGFSGSGKGTLMKALLSKYTNYALSISATTRKPRAGEEDGRDYFFRTTEAFKQMIEEDALLEHACYVDNYYGTPKDYVFSNLDQGKDVLLEIEIQGALKVREEFPDAVLLFIAPPSAAELKNRLVGRGTEAPDVIEARLRRASKEAEGVEQYDYLLINDRVEDCVERMHSLIQSIHARVNNHRLFISKIREELREI